MTLVTVAPLAAAAGGLAAPTTVLLSQQLVLAFVVLVGVRAAFTVPAELSASWVFRANESREADAALSGVRRAVVVGVVLPMFALLIPLHAWLWGASVALLHFVAGFACAVLLVEVLLFANRRIPFTSPYVPGKANLKTRWSLYLLGLVVFTQGFAALELRALSHTLAFAVFLAAIGGAAIALAWINKRALRGSPLLFDNEAEPSVQTLELG